MRSTSASVRSFGTRSRATTAASGRKAALVPDRNVNISSRPLTAAAGIARGSSQSSSKPTGTRSVQDRTYFHTLLAGKVDDIEAEIQRLSEETEAIDANCSRQASRQQVYDSLLGETNKLEMTIADFNFAISKERSGADPEEIEALALGLKEHNDELANEVDNLFMKNQYSQNEVKRLENEMHSLRKSFESLLDNSDEDTIFEYERLTAQLKAIKDERVEVEGEVEALKGRMDEVRHTLSMRIDQDTCKRLDTEEENITALNTDLSAFEDKVRIAQMGEDDARLFFLDKIKTNKARLNELDKEHDDLHKELRELKKTEREHVDFLRDAESTGGLKNDKEMKMYSKVKDAQEYISLAKERIDSLQADNNAKQSMINDLEEDLSNRLISSKVEMPTQDKFQELNDTVNFRSKHLTSSQITMNRLSEQKDKRREELEKVRDLETKIYNEQNRLTSSIDEMNTEMVMFEDVENLEDEEEAKKEYLRQMKDRFLSREEFMASEAKKVSAEYDKAKNLLDSNRVWQSLVTCEDKIARQVQVVHSLQNFVTTHGKQIEYEQIKRKCLHVAEELNNVHLAAQ